MRKTGLKRFVPIIARDPTKKNAGNREISTAFLGKFPVGNSLYSNIKAAETPAVGKIAEKIGHSPKFHKKAAAPLRRTKLCSKAGRSSVSPCGVILEQLPGVYLDFGLSTVPLRGVIVEYGRFNFCRF